MISRDKSGRQTKLTRKSLFWITTKQCKHAVFTTKSLAGVKTFKSNGRTETFKLNRFAQAKDMNEWVAPVSIKAVKELPAM
jgi:hypothetical protein